MSVTGPQAMDASGPFFFAHPHDITPSGSTPSSTHTTAVAVAVRSFARAPCSLCPDIYSPDPMTISAQAQAHATRRPIGQRQVWSLRISCGRACVHAHNAKTPISTRPGFSLIKCLAMTYSHMRKPHTTIGDDAFHC